MPLGTVAGVITGIVAVAANWSATVTVLPGAPVTVALLPLIVAVNPAEKVCPLSAVSVTLAVYCVAAANGLLLGAHVTAPISKLPVPVAAVLGVAPVAGAVTVIAAVMIGAKVVAANVNDNVTAVPVLLVTVAFCPFIVAAKPDVGNV